MNGIDAWFIAKFESACHHIQRLTGVTNFRIARWLYGIFATSPILFGIVLWQTDHMTPFKAGMCIGMAMAFIWASRFLVYICDGLDTYYAEGHGSAHSYTLHFREKWISRFLFMLAVPFIFGVMIDEVGGFSWHLTIPAIAISVCIPWVYALCVIPLPPGRSKIQEWLESFKPKPELAKIPVR